MPHIKPVTGVRGAWELRVKADTNIYRYFFIIIKDRAVILHSFPKKTQKIPEKELKILKRRIREI